MLCFVEHEPLIPVCLKAIVQASMYRATRGQDPDRSYFRGLLCDLGSNGVNNMKYWGNGLSREVRVPVVCHIAGNYDCTHSCIIQERDASKHCREGIFADAEDGV